MWKNILRIGVPSVIVILLLVMNVYQRIEYKNTTKELLKRIDILTQVISKKDSTVSYYSKIVDNFDVKERDLKKQLKKLNQEFADRLKDKEERILSLSEYNIELQRKVDTLNVASTVKDNILSFEIEDYYPNPDNYFVKYTGYVQAGIGEKISNPVIAREFSFNPIKINMVMTETTRGAWKYNILDAPDWIGVSSVDVKSLPPEEYKPAHERGYQFMVGGGVLKMYQGRSYLTISAGIKYKKWVGVASGGLGGIQATAMYTLSKK